MTLPFETARISPRQLNRRSFIGGSDARIIMGSDEGALLRLWREKRGEAEPEDLSDNLIVQLGLATEPLNRHWFERNTGHVITQVQQRVEHPVIRWMAATLDGMVEQTGVVFEAKFMLPVWTRAAPPADRSGADRRHERIQCLGGIRWRVSAHARGSPRA
jgi:predicted phage-related endonuclease